MYGCRLEEGCNASVSKSRATARICTLGDSGMLASKNSSQQLKKARRANKECSNVPMAPSPCRPTSYADPPSEDEPRLYEEHGRTPAHRKSKLPHQPTTDKFEPKMLRDRTSPARRPAAAAEASRRRSRGQSGRTGSPGSWRGLPLAVEGLVDFDGRAAQSAEPLLEHSSSRTSPRSRRAFKSVAKTSLAAAARRWPR